MLLRGLMPFVIFILLIAANVTLRPVQAQPLTAPEYQVKAAFIYNFAKFVEWPVEMLGDGRPFVIGIVGKDPFGNLIDEAISGKSVRDKNITVKRFSKLEEAVDAHILFISASEEKRLPEMINHLSRTPVLTVSDIDRFAGQGGMVQLVMDQNRVRFAVNVAAFERARLKPSSQLLKLARIVPDGGADNKFPGDEWYSELSIYHPLRTVFSRQIQKLTPWLKEGARSVSKN